MAENALSAESREGTGKGVARKLRQKGQIPAVIYGRKRAAQSIIVNPDALRKLLRGEAGLNTLIDLTLAGATSTVLVKGLERDPVRGTYLHADFYEVDLTQKVTVSVPVHLVGKAAGIEMGGILDHPLRELSIECLPREIPKSIDVDVTSLNVNESIHVSDLKLAAGLTIKTDGSLAVASVVLPQAEEAAAAETTEVAAEGEAAAAAPAADAAKGDAKAAPAKADAKPDKGGDKKK
ncbi:MAG: 50S ribosomal protein L25/general stress protein Ctc [Deltaproteobacteria bacterium]|nr:50S ribosomal protein L25/general stress protein Ctc [Deltaproteobacteria bacterium]